MDIEHVLRAEFKKMEQELDIMLLRTAALRNYSLFDLYEILDMRRKIILEKLRQLLHTQTESQ